MKKFITIIGLAAAVSLAGGHAQVFIGDPTPSAGDTGVFAYWNFNDIATDGSALPADFYGQAGSTSISFDGYGGTLDSFGGSSINAQDGAPSGDDLALRNGTSGAINGTFLEIALDMSNLEDLSIEYALRSSGTGVDDVQWSYSTDGVAFTDFGPNMIGNDLGYDLVTNHFSAITTTGLDQSSTAFLRLTMDGGSTTSSAGNNRIDNLTISATVIPEPGTWALIGLGSAVVLWRMRRRNTTA
jgi:hypothetical protein